MNTAIKFKNRMKTIGIDIDLSSNYPWIYINKINGNKVKEKYFSEHAYTLCFSHVGSIMNQKGLFELIRKYI